MQVRQVLQHGGAEVPFERLGGRPGGGRVDAARKFLGIVAGRIQAVPRCVAQQPHGRVRTGGAVLEPRRHRAGSVQPRRQQAGIQRGVDGRCGWLRRHRHRHRLGGAGQRVDDGQLGGGDAAQAAHARTDTL